MADMPPETITAAAKAAYEAWQRARGVPEGPPGDYGWSLIGPVPRQRWEAAAAAAAPLIAAAEQARSEALIVQAQDYASAESERADKLAALALKILNQCVALHPTGEASYLDEWSMALDQLEGAAGEMSPPDSDPLEEAYQTGIKAERESCASLAESAGATYAGEPEPCGCDRDDCTAVRHTWLPFADLLRKERGDG
jgi:hypothetical protein